MKRSTLLFGLVFLLTGTAHAQADKYPTAEVFGGPSVLRNGATAPSFSLYGGWQAQASYNFNSHVGVTTDFGAQYRSISGSRVSQYEYLFGPRFTARASRTTLFAHALVGANTLRASGRSTNGFAWAVGGGLDYNVSKHFSIRMIQADYLRTRLSNSWFNDARLGVGVVFKF